MEIHTAVTRRIFPFVLRCALASLGFLLAVVGTAAPDEVRTIRIGVEVNSPPLSSALADGVTVGFAPELLREMQATGLVKFEIVPGYWSQILRQFETGEIDALANVIITEERRKTMWYSIPHATLHGLTYTRPGDPPITSTEQFAGKSMVMLNGTISQLDAANHQGWGASMVIDESWAKVLSRVKNGEFDFALLTRQLSFEQPDELGLHRDFVDDIIYRFHIVVHPGDTEGLEQINAALARVQHEGIYDRLYSQWVGPIEPHPIRLNDLRPYFLSIATALALLAAFLFWLRYNHLRLQRQTNALRESTDLLRMTGSMAHLGGWTVDLLSGKTNLSDEAAVIYGVPRDFDIPVQAAIKFYAPEWREKITAVFEACAREGTPYDEELELINTQGQRLWVRTIGEPVRDQEGKIIKVQGTLQDITKRRQIEDDLRESEQRFRSAVVSSPIPMLLHAEDGEIIGGSDSWYAISGYEPEELKTIDDWTERAYGERQQLLRAQIKSLYSLTDNKAEGNFTIRAKSGALRIWDFHSASLGRLPDGRRLVNSMATDITERKQSELQLRKLSNIIEQAPLSIVIIDLEGLIEYTNPRFTLVTGYLAHEVLGKDLFKINRKVYRGIWDTLKRGQVWSGELISERKNGELYNETAVIAPILNEQGETTHYAALKEDITAQQRREAEATTKLAQQQEISEMKTRFISVASHQFRTPMASVMGSVEILANHSDRLSPEKCTELFGRINSSLNRMTIMLDEVLLLNRIDAKRLEVNPTKLELGDFVKDIMELVKMSDTGEHRFEILDPSKVGTFVTDGNLLNHILENLLSNAVRYSPGGSLITVELAWDENELQLIVADQGMGIPLEDQAHIFEAFERGSNVGTIKGTGLGLNIVERMTKLLSGTITLECPESGGCRFTVTLPEISETPTAEDAAED